MIFVFGSNLAGRHGKGAAKFAVENHGAIYGQGEGRQGNSYAIPTKSKTLGPLDWVEDIDPAIGRFCRYAELSKGHTFLLTPVGCGLAGHSKKDLVKSLRRHQVPRNVVLASSWITDK